VISFGATAASDEQRMSIYSTPKDRYGTEPIEICLSFVSCMAPQRVDVLNLNMNDMNLNLNLFDITVGGPSSMRAQTLV
jgi:hypothetical protein